MAKGLNIQFLWETFFVALSGVPITLLVTVVALAIALPVGFLLALSRFYRVPILNRLSQVYISFVRGTPIIIQIFIVYSSIPLMLDLYFKKYDVGVNVYEIHPLWFAFIVFSFNTTAILIEVFRSALQSLDEGQYEAAQSIGLTTIQAYRRIVIPQLLVVALPNICTATVNLIKATSLGYALSLQEITLRAKVAANVNYNYIEAYLAIFIVYLLLCSAVEYAFKLYEKRLTKHRFVIT